MKQIFLSIAIISALTSCDSGDESASTSAIQPAEQNDTIIQHDAQGGEEYTEKTNRSEKVSKSKTKKEAAGSPEGLALKNLMANSDCAACHQIDTRSIGPSYVEVAQKYENTPQVIKYLAEKIKQGGSGVWGEIPMAAHPNLKMEEAEQLAKDIMALKK